MVPVGITAIDSMRQTRSQLGVLRPSVDQCSLCTLNHSLTLVQKSRTDLERYLFYCNRYVNHLKSLKMEHKLYDMAHQKMGELQQLSMSWIEVSASDQNQIVFFINILQAQFLQKAVDVLCLCRQTLMYTYAFAFYLRKNNHTLIFEDNQRDLEMATETLSEYLERDITSSTINDMKIYVQDKAKYVTYFLSHLYKFSALAENNRC